MEKLSLVREDAAAIAVAALPTSVGVVDHIPDSVAPPVVLVAWSDPWLTPDTFCGYEARLEIIAVAQRLEPGGKVETLEDICAALVDAYKASGVFTVVDLTSPYPLEIAGVSYLAASVNITKGV